MTAPLTVPVLDDEEYDGEVHETCCNVDRARCGEDLAGEPFVADDAPLGCTRCEVLAEFKVPCGAWFCRQRRWLRKWWS